MRALLSKWQKHAWFGSVHLPHSGKSLEVFDDSLQNFVDTLASLSGDVCVGADLNVDLAKPYLDDGRACLTWDELQERRFTIQIPPHPTWVSHAGTEKTLDYFVMRLCPPCRVASDADVVPHLRSALGSDHRCVGMELRTRRAARSPAVGHADVSLGCGRWQFQPEDVREAIELLRAYRDRDVHWSADEFAWLARKCRKRFNPWRFQDPDEIRELVLSKQTTVSVPVREYLSRRIAELRALARASFKAQVLKQAAEGHPGAMRHLQRRKRSDMQHFFLRHKGSGEAVAHLKA